MSITGKLSIVASCALCIAFAQSAQADYFGLEVLERTDLTICQDPSEPEIPYKLDVCEIHVVFDDPADRLISTALCDVSTTAPQGFYQHTLGGNTAPACNLIPLFPTLVCDSFVTLGLECDTGGSTTDPDFDSTGFNSSGEVSGGWFNSAPPNGQGAPDANDRVMIARFSYKQNKNTSGNVCVFAKLAGSDDITTYLMQPFDCSDPGMQGGGGGAGGCDSPPVGSVLYVDGSVAESGNGSSWCDAYKDLQEALDAALPDDEIHVAQGTYKPGAPFAPRTTSYVLQDDVWILGGYEGGCSNPCAHDRDIEVNVTTLDGDLNSDDEDDFTVLSQPDFVYTNNTTIMPIGGGPPVNFIDDGTLRIDFSSGLLPISNPGDFCGPGTPWNDPPFTSDQGNPTLLDTGYAINSVTLTFTSAKPVKTFGVEARHSLCIEQNITMEFWDGAQLLGTVSRDISSARLFVASTVDDSFTHVVLSTVTNGGGLYFTRPRYSFASLDFAREENVYHVVDGSGTAESAILDGFTVTAGYASGDGSDGCGSGMQVGDGSPTIQNCTFSDNFTPWAGGGMCIDSGSPTVTNCIFTANTAQDPEFGAGSGGGVFGGSGAAQFIDCEFSNNSVGVGSGGGMLVGGTAQLTGCLFENNTAGSGGGVIIGGTPQLDDCVFKGNSAGYGGAIYINTAASPTISNSSLIGNTAGNWGSAIVNHSNSFPDIINCLVSGNTGARAIQNFGVQLNITNCTIWANEGGIMGLFNNVTNCVIWGNGAGQNAQVAPGSTPEYSCIQDCTTLCADPDDHNTGADPLFTDRDGWNDIPGDWDDDLRPRAGAPVNDAGDNTVPGLVGIVTDLDGNPRFVDDPAAPAVGYPPGEQVLVDMGAYEFQAISSCPEDFDGNGNVGPFDLAFLLGAWGPNPGHPADLDGDGAVGPFDLAVLLGAWGPCDDACGSSGDCCDFHLGTGCDDTPCCASVCELDPFCCDVEWDDNCAEASWVSCTICDSDCCEDHETAGCDNDVCAAIVCAIPYAQVCCTTEWYPACVTLAQDNCVGLCSP